MAINIKFDLSGNPELPTIILANRNGNKLGQLKVNADSVDLIDKFNDASELSFAVNKYIDGELSPLWDELVDFKLVWCKEWDLWLEIKVELDEEIETVKTVFGTQLGQAELSQIMLYNIEINTEDDIARDDYKISILWDELDPKLSILDRLLEKAPHYSIIHVDDTIKNIQRSFSFDGTSIHDAFQEISEEIGCLFIYHSNSDEDGKIQRTISVYDLQQNCLNPECKHRGEFTDKCPKCDNTNIKQGFGNDTLIFVTADELATQGIQLVTDVDSVKNCFKLEGGDDLMTATIRNCNPNGSDYIWYFSDVMKNDMSKDLVEKLNSYDVLYKDYCNNHESILDGDLVNKYNTLVQKYESYYNTKSTCINCDYEDFFYDNCPKCGNKNVLSGKKLQSIPSTIKGYSSLMNTYYNTIDLALYLGSALMPTIEMSDTNAQEQAALLIESSLSSVAVNTQNKEAISLATANSAILSMAKIIVKSTYKVEVKTSTLSNDKVWQGNFVVTNYSDENDTAESQTISVAVNNDTETFIKQKIEKALNKEDIDDYSISGLFEKDYNDFCAELKKYALNPLKSFYDSCDACLNILIDQGAGNENENPDLYEKLYRPYYEKSSAISSEIKIREKEIAIIEGVWDKTADEENPKLITKGLQQYIEECKKQIQAALDFEKYLGEELWLEYCSYRREDTYSNDNYISDGLNNAELFEKALGFIEVAENEIYKSAELQCSISTSLNNLLAIDKFKPLAGSFKLGNWIRVQIDNKIYKLRLIEYEMDFGSFKNISVEFSEVTKVKSGVTDLKSVVDQASSMATSYDSIQRQAKQGNDAKSTVNQWLENGLNSANVKIKSNNNEEVTLDKNGLLCRSYDDIADNYSPEQFRLTHNIMAYTTDNWETVSAALGKHNYKYYNGNKELQDGIDYGLSAKFVTAGYINGSQIIGGEIFSQNYTSTTGTYLDLNNGNFSWAGGKIKYDGKDLVLKGVNLTWEDIGDAPTKVSEFENDADYKTGAQITQITKDTVTTSYVNALKVTADSVAAENITGTTISGKTISGGTVSGAAITGGSLNIKDRFIVDGNGNLTAKANADITGKITATFGKIGGWLIDGNTLKSGENQSGTSYFYIDAGTANSYIAAKDAQNNWCFRVNKDGTLYSTKATISGDSTFGGTLNAADGTFKGELSAVSGSFTSLTAGRSSFKTNQVVIDATYTNSQGQEMAKGSVYIGQSGYTDANGTLWDEITIRPNKNNLGNIGTTNYSWDMLCVKNGAIHSSDRNYKKDISVMGEKQEELFNLLTPVTFKFIDSTHDRFHYGYISQDVEDAINKVGLTTKDFAGFCKDVKMNDDGTPALDENGNPEYIYSLRYTEFIALNTHMIQKVQAENQKLKERIDSLEQMIMKLS